MSKKELQISLILILGAIAGCSSTPSKPQEQQIIGDIPAGSPFSKLKPGMSIKQVHDLIGEPTDTGNHMTGKMFIPFYFGSDTMRQFDLYKGQGRIIYTGAGIGGINFTVYRIEYDPSEDGYNNK